MDMQELEQYLSMGTDEETILDLLRQAERAEGESDATRGKDYLIGSGRVNVANPWGAVSDVFVRGNAEKRAKEAREQAARGRSKLDQKTMAWMTGQLGGRQGALPVEANIPAGPPQVKPPAQFPMPQAPQVPPMPQPAPARPPVQAPQRPAPSFNMMDEIRRRQEGGAQTTDEMLADLGLGRELM